ESWVAELTRAIHSRKLLLVLDNCEHVTSATADLVGGLLRACPSLTLLAISLQPLGVSGETTWRVPPLPLPSPSPQEPQEPPAHEAVHLLITHVTAHPPDFAITPEK